MRNKYISILTLILLVFNALSCSSNKDDETTRIMVDESLEYCQNQIARSLKEIDKDTCLLPRNMEKNAVRWHMVNPYDWTSGFWPGILWYNYENSKDESIKEKAIQYTECLESLLSPNHDGDHDLGFQFLCSYVNGYRLTGNDNYRQIALKGAEKLAGFYNPSVGTILSWAHMSDQMGWPHNTIMDNMMNLELLFWASKNGGKPEYYKMAERHAQVTMENQFRDDYTNYHVAIYDTITGKFMRGVTNQGLNDQSFWARGQAWAIYGFTMVYRETKNKDFLRFVEKVTDVYLERLPEDYVPYWDFDDPAIPNAPRDASAAAITASALLELSQLEDDSEKSATYKDYAIKMIKSLSSENYRSADSKPSFILHSTGNLPAGYEIDASINYADYYYLESLIRYKKMHP